ncbi:DUF4307 domain-containing protein [Solicola sp. PLA-1-18]|uniref:DUF4307 domain-containing protein n=1 Tax=Solicola sp. PLA-1-18 TaxID=3380532 RepID=UPI003B82325F
MPASTSSPDLVGERYGRTGRSRTFWYVFSAVAILLGVAWAWYAASAQSQPDVAAQVYGYEVVSDTSTQVELQVERSEGAAAVCEVYAIAQDHSIVGERTVDLPAGEPGSTRVSADIRTERRAVTGTIRTCRTTE